MRILVVGAGIGGMTLTALLGRAGLRPRLVERAPDLRHAGYMLGLWPLGTRVLHGLSLYDRFAAECVEGRFYEVRDNTGRLVKRWSLEPIADRRRRRVERIQADSRRLARLMFVKSPAVARLRNWATRFYSVEQLAGSIAKAFDEPV